MASDPTKILYGGDLMLFTGSGSTTYPLAFSQSAKISISAKTRDISSKDSGYWGANAPGQLSWNCSTEGLMSYGITGGTQSIDALYTIFVNRSLINVVFATATGTAPNWTISAVAGQKKFTGQGYITSFDMNAQNNDTATWSIQIEGYADLVMS